MHIHESMVYPAGVDMSHEWLKKLSQNIKQLIADTKIYPMMQVTKVPKGLLRWNQKLLRY